MGILFFTKYVVCGQVGMSDSCSELNQEQKYLKTNSDNDVAEEKRAVSELEVSFLENSRSQVTRPTTLQKLAFKMFNVIKEVTIMLLAIVTYAALTSNPPKISKSPAAFPFFPEDSLVTDYYKGELSIAKDRSRTVDISFVMFYAPWSAECTAVRDEFEVVAKHFHNQIEISAVNCWHPDGECRRQYSRVYSWPVLIAYPTIGKGIQYKGPKLASYMMKFIMGVMKPFVRVTRVEEILHLLTIHDVVIVGRVNALPNSQDFAVLYSTALRYLSQDPMQNVALAIQTIPKTDELGNNLKPNLSLYMWNETFFYPRTNPWTPNALIEWLTNTMHQITMWLVPPRSKSNILAYTLQSTPAVLLFTPRNPIRYSNDFYSLLKEVALEFNSCGNPRVTWLKEAVNAKRTEEFYSYKYLLQKCSVIKDIFTVSSIENKHKWVNISALKQFRDSADEKINLCYHEEFSAKLKTLSLDDDPKSPQNLEKNARRETCRLLRIAEKMLPNRFTDLVRNNTKIDESVEGLGCNSNRSLLFYALDSLETYYFAEKLGIDLFKMKDNTAAVIIDDTSETHYVLNKPVNDATLRDFVRKYTHNTLPRSRKSITSIKSDNTYSYETKTRCDTNKSICVKELDSTSFLPTILQKDKAAVILYYSKQCSFCSGISFIFLTLAKIFGSIRNVQFARIDGDLNILPWEYSMNQFPTIIYFPEKRKSESRAFPQNVPITIPNLLAFLMSNFNPRLKLHAMWVLCKESQFKDEINLCLSSVRAENLSLINHTLKEWRKADVKQRADLMYRLQQLRSLHLLLAHSPDKDQEIRVHFNRLNANNVGINSHDRNFHVKQNVKDEL